MPSTDAFALPHSGLNEFLFAAIGTEANGMTLSVLSAFARLGHDPWQEAARLAGLPKSEAAESLARTIAGMPTSTWPLPAATEIATRLIALLPLRSAKPGHCPPTLAYAAKARHFIRLGVVLTCVAFAAAYDAGVFTTMDAPTPRVSNETIFVPSHP
jgi:hypothetical protein